MCHIIDIGITELNIVVKKKHITNILYERFDLVMKFKASIP